MIDEEHGWCEHAEWYYANKARAERVLMVRGACAVLAIAAPVAISLAWPEGWNAAVLSAVACAVFGGVALLGLPN